MNRDSKKPILIAAALVAAIISIAIFLWFGGTYAISKARVFSATSALVAVRNSLTGYHLEFGRFPDGTSSNILDELIGKNTKGIVFLYLSGSSSPLFIDPWGEPYIFIPASGLGGPEFYSKGPDRIDDSCRPSSDDIRSGKP